MHALKKTSFLKKNQITSIFILQAVVILLDVQHELL